MMNRKKYFPQLAFCALCALGSFAYAAEEPSVALDSLGAGVREIKVGDNVPDEYQRESLALKDWKARHLSAPDEHEQWVEIEDKYVLVNIPSGAVKKMVEKSKTKQ